MCLDLGWTTSNYCESNLCVVKETCSFFTSWENISKREEILLMKSLKVIVRRLDSEYSKGCLV